MDRLGLRRIVALLVVLAAAVAQGCMGPILTGAYLLGAADTPAEFKGLARKKVVVVCRPLVQLQYRDVNASNMLATEVGKLLKKNIRFVEIVSQEKVAQWLDGNASDDYLEVGRALGAEMVVGIDLVDFSIYQGQTLYQGRASYALKVYDCSSGDLVYDKTPDPAIWPPSAGIPTSERQESEFRRRFVGVLADEIARRFYNHDARNYFAGDATALD